MSGGVDSSVSALLLKQQGYDVVGFFMKLWHDPCGTSENACCDERALMDARKVATQLGITFYVVDARKVFKKEIVDYFIDEYKNLRTPNPCILCNQKIKFGWLLDFAEKVGCDKLATGHYAKITQDDEEFYHLSKGFDKAKDQSYFLYQLGQDKLSKVVFPLSEMSKEDTRAIAEKEGLLTYKKKDSQEICFVAGNDYREFLKRHLDESYFKSGKIVDKSGFTVGIHNGLVNYTIGQRKDVNQELKIMNKGENKKPLYAIGFDLRKNELIVGADEDLYKKEFEIVNTYWTGPRSDYGDLKVRIRYKAREVTCQINEIQEGKFKVILDVSQRAVTPGQSAVFYHGDEVVGGGIIDRVD